MASFSSPLWSLEVDTVAQTKCLCGCWQRLPSSQQEDHDFSTPMKKKNKKWTRRRSEGTQAPGTPQFIPSHTTSEDRKTGGPQVCGLKRSFVIGQCLQGKGHPSDMEPDAGLLWVPEGAASHRHAGLLCLAIEHASDINVRGPHVPMPL